MSKSTTLMAFRIYDSLNNKKTLFVRVKDNLLSYTLIGGWANSGTPFSLRNMQIGCSNGMQRDLPTVASNFKNSKELKRQIELCIKSGVITNIAIVDEFIKLEDVIYKKASDFSLDSIDNLLKIQSAARKLINAINERIVDRWEDDLEETVSCVEIKTIEKELSNLEQLLNK